MNCPHCYQPVPEKSAFCPHCGARQADGGNHLIAVEAADDPTYGALAQANLLRLRGDWDNAREKTVEVMRAYPNSGTAHSLMGDIYADQGHSEEAAQWYRMALDLEPDNAADARKLAAMEARLREEAALEEMPERPPRLSPLVLIGWAAGTFLIIVIALGLWLNSQRPPEGTEPAPPPRPRAPVAGTPPGPPSAAPGTSTGPGSAPETTPREPGAGQVRPPATPPVGSQPSSPAPETAFVQTETALVEALRPTAPQLAAAGLSLVSAQIDPRVPAATLTLDGSRVNGAAANWMEQVYGGALNVAAEALRADGTLRRVTVRVEMPLRAETGIVRDIAFIGDLDRPARLAPTAAPSAFDHRWWRPGLTPPPALAATGS